jgi:hypothetical protein
VTDEYVQGSKTASTTAAVSAGPARKYLAEVSSEVSLSLYHGHLT